MHRCTDAPMNMGKKKYNACYKQGELKLYKLGKAHFPSSFHAL